MERDIRSKDGFSLVELIICIAIMAIMVSLVTIGISFLKSADTKGAALSLDSSLTQLKSKGASSKEPQQMALFMKNGATYVTYGVKGTVVNTSVLTDAKKIAESDVNVEVVDSSGASNTLGEGDVYYFYTLKKDGSSPNSPKQVTFSSNQAVAHKVTLVTLTGKHFVD